MSETFAALLVNEPNTRAQLAEVSIDDLDDGDVTIAVEWSGLNYKDALAVTGSGPVVRRFPMICGIDLAGTVLSSSNPDVPSGSAVVVTGSGLGERHSGGFSRVARVPSPWCTPLPEVFTLRQAMALGTAGVTAMLSFLALERLGSGPGELDGFPLLVTGASGGVGSLAVLIGATLGYEVWASTGRPEQADFLMSLGATAVVDRREFANGLVPALGTVRFGAAVDVVGGTTLANVLTHVRPGGTVAASGLVGGSDLPTTVHPFILRGVTLAGVNSVELTRSRRSLVWTRLATAVTGQALDAVTHEIALDHVPATARGMLDGMVRGRTVVAIGSKPSVS